VLAVVVAAFPLLLMASPASAVSAPDVTWVSPGQGPTSGGTAVTIAGNDFTGTTSVYFGLTPAASWLVINDGFIVAVSPPHTAGTVHVTVTTVAGGPSASTPADRFTFVGPAAVQVSSISPAVGPTSGGTVVTVYGSGFAGTLSVYFGGVPSPSFAVLNDGILQAVAPAHTAGTVHVVVSSVSGSSAPTAADLFTYGGVPFVVSVSPTFGPTSGGTVVTVTGAGFTGATAVTFGGYASSSFAVVDDGELIAVSPAHFAGPVDVVVWVGSTPSATSAYDVFTYVGGLYVYSVSPSTGPSYGGTAVTITGTGFTGATAVTFGGAASTNFTVLNDSHIVAVAPPHAAGTYHVIVWTALSNSPPTAADLFMYTGASVVTGISPAAGPTSGGTTVTITGIGLTGVSLVTFGGVAASNLAVVSDTQIVVVTPPHVAGVVDVLAWVSGIASPASSAALFAYTEGTAPNPPARFAGSVTIDGHAAPAGTLVEARVGTSPCGTAATFMDGGVARYVLDVPAADSGHPGCGTESAAVAFYTGGIRTAESGVWHSYQLNQLNLTASTGAPIPPPPPPPAPGPPNTGTGSGYGSPIEPSWLAALLIGVAIVGSAVSVAYRRRSVRPVLARDDVDPAELGDNWRM
jgi:hypothetical protein